MKWLCRTDQSYSWWNQSDKKAYHNITNSDKDLICTYIWVHYVTWVVESGHNDNEICISVCCSVKYMVSYSSSFCAAWTPRMSIMPWPFCPYGPTPLLLSVLVLVKTMQLTALRMDALRWLPRTSPGEVIICDLDWYQTLTGRRIRIEDLFFRLTLPPLVAMWVVLQSDKPITVSISLPPPPYQELCWDVLPWQISFTGFKGAD